MLLEPLSRWRGIVTLLSLLIVALASAQGGPSATISVSPSRVQGLSYNASTGHQEATWTCTVTPNGNYGQLNFVTWSVDGVTGVSYGPSTPIHNFVYTATGPGKHTVTAYLSYAIGVTATKTIAAIGGPLSPGIVPGDQNTPTTDLAAGGSGSAKYIQYFGYDPSTGTPSGAQTPQMGTLTPALGQPSGTTYSWSVIGNASFVGSITASQVTLGATGQSGYGSDGAHCTFNYTDPSDSTLTGSAQDDSDQTPPPGTTSADPNYYRFTGHQPNAILNASKTNQSTIVGPPRWGIVDQYQMKVKDHLGLLAGGVWVQERFPDGPYSGTNANGTHWTTATDGTLGYRSNDGTFTAFPDTLGISLDEPYTYASSSGVSYQPRVQKYYGGTSSTSLSASGVYLGTFNCYFWTDQTQHNAVADQ